jgi:hypothetical protein
MTRATEYNADNMEARGKTASSRAQTGKYYANRSLAPLQLKVKASVLQEERERHSHLEFRESRDIDSELLPASGVGNVDFPIQT